MVGTRRERRYLMLKSGLIGVGTSEVQCKVCDLSMSGAALSVDRTIGIPKHFALAIPEHDLRLPCHVVWRSGCRVGVQFGYRR